MNINEQMNQRATSLTKFIHLHCSLALKRSALLCSLRSPHPQRSASLCSALLALLTRSAALRCSLLLTCSTELRSQLTKSAFLVVLAPPSMSILYLMRMNMMVRPPSLSCVDDDDVAIEDVEDDIFGVAMLVVARTTTTTTTTTTTMKIMKFWMQACT